MIAIKVENLCKCYKNKHAVDGLSLEISEGELFALLGVNGAGKSTTIKILSCLSKPDDGSVQILGYDIYKEPHKIKENINVSPQETAVADNLSTEENLMLIASIYGTDKAAAKEKVDSSIKEMGLEKIRHQRAKTLSGGWKRRLSIAMALISEPKILFLDEPTLGLDVLARRELWNEIEKLKHKATVILTTHYLEEAEALSDRIGIMSEGNLVAVGTASELTEQAECENFEEAFIKLATKGGDNK